MVTERDRLAEVDARETAEPILVTLSPDNFRFITEYDPERERSASRRDMVAVVEEIQALVIEGAANPRAKEAS